MRRLPPLPAETATAADSRGDPPLPKPNAWLLPAAAIYEAVIRRRNRYYDNPQHVSRAAAPIVSVGNLTTGGTGKTPIVIVICQLLRELGVCPAILTRGYGAVRDETADEVREFQLALRDVPVVVNPDRVAGSATAIRDHRAQICVLDDGFQHRRLHRDLDVVVLDGLDPFGRGAMLPAGRLREPLESLRRAHVIIVNRANQVSAARIASISDQIRRSGAVAPILAARVHAAPESLPKSAETAIAVAGIGNPRTFERLLLDGGIRPREFLVFDDHHRYSASDARELAAVAGRAGATVVVTTRKDWVKLSQVWPSAAPRLQSVELSVSLDDAGGELASRLRSLVRKGPA